MKKILLVSGCSNTEKDFYSDVHPDLDTSWPKWPELLAKKLDMYCVNLAKSGMGNEYIYTTLLRYITKTNREIIGLVIPAWTQCQRKDFQIKGSWNNQRIDPNGDVFSWMSKSLDYCLSFQILCERYNLPYMQVQMLSPYIDWLRGLLPAYNGHYPKGFRHTYPGDKQRDNKRLIDLIDDYEDKINTKKFIGWPLSHEYGGYSIQKKLIGIRNDKNNDKIFKFANKEYILKEAKQDIRIDTMISSLDSHPNKKGHKVIAEFIYERL